MNRIIIASKNRGKILEIREMLSSQAEVCGFGNLEMPVCEFGNSKTTLFEFLDLYTLGFEGTIEENGRTFKENALIKAEVVFERYGAPVVAEDSGLSVFALGGRPGVMSARFAGPGATDEENNTLLLEMLKDVPDGARGAFFFCSAVFLYGRGEYLCGEGRIDGFIAREPAGENGFGYDPLFSVPHLGKTMAQLPTDVKNVISHRSIAIRELARLIRAHGMRRSPGA